MAEPHDDAPLPVPPAETDLGAPSGAPGERVDWGDLPVSPSLQDQPGLTLGLSRQHFTSALLGGLLVAVALVLAGKTTWTVKQTRVVQTRVVPRELAPARRDGRALSPREIYRRSSPGVVFIRTRSPIRWLDAQGREEKGARPDAGGSGFVVDGSGLILTNAHVVSQAAKVEVVFQGEQTRQAQVVGRDPSSDLALLRVKPAGIKLSPLPLGDSNEVVVGDPVVAIGNPLGLEGSLTTGVVSALGRAISAPNGFSIGQVIQTDAAINPGNSGGPLLDGNARVIGINSQIATASGSSGSIGIGFAVPVNTARRVLRQLRTSGKASHAYLGILGADLTAELAREFDLPVQQGALLQQVTPGGPAAKAGLRGGTITAVQGGRRILLGGDVIVRLGGKQVHNMRELSRIIEASKVGQRLQIDYLRHGHPRRTSAVLAERPARVG